MTRARLRLGLIAIACALCTLAAPQLGSSQARWIVKLGTSAREGAPLALAMHALGDAIAADHGKRLWVKRFADGALGRRGNPLERVAQGEVHGYAASFEELSAFAPELAVLGGPFLFEDAGAAQRAMRGRVGALIGDALADRGLRVVAVGACETRDTLSASALPAAKDLKGMRIAQPRSAAARAFAAALSLSPVDDAASVELREATLAELLAQPVAGHLTLTDHAVECGAIVLSQRWLDGLPEQMRKTVTRLPKDIGSDATAAQSALRAKLIEHAKAIGLRVRTLSGSERHAFVAASRDAYDALLKGASDVAAKLVFAARN